jgi:hypothetical protein
MENKIVGICIITLLILLTIGGSAKMIIKNQEEPEIPIITGNSEGKLYHDYEYFITSIDPQNDDIYYVVRCSDCPSIYLSDFKKSGEPLSFHHCWCDFYQTSNPFKIYARAVDTNGYQSDWGTFEITIENCKERSLPNQLVVCSPIARLLSNVQFFQEFINHYNLLRSYRT